MTQSEQATSTPPGQLEVQPSASSEPSQPINVHKYSETFIAATLFSLSSIGMILINKAVVMAFPYSAILLIVQNFATIILLKVANRDLKMEASTTLQWVPCSALFCLNLVSSMESLSAISVPTFTIFRNTQPAIAALLDFLVRGERTSGSSLYFLFLIFVGALLYCKHDIQFNVYGYSWAIAHVLSMSAYSVVVKLRCASLKLAASEMSFYNNMLSFPILFMLEFGDTMVRDGGLAGQVKAAEICVTKLLCIGVILLSCFGGFAVSVSGFRAQQAMSPTSWLTLNNLSKIPAIGLSLILFGGDIKPSSVHGMSIAMLGGYLYSLSRQGRVPSVLIILSIGLTLSFAYHETDLSFF